MPREPDDVSLLWDMLEAARRIQHFMEGKTLADYSCAFPSTSRRPTIAGASRHGDNVKVSAALARYSNEISAALVPAPAPGGQLELTIPGSVLSLKDKHPDRCIVPVEDGLKSTRRD